MKNDIQPNCNRRRLAARWSTDVSALGLITVLIVLILGSGCRNSTGSQSGNSGVFDFGQQSRSYSNGAPQQFVGNQPVGSGVNGYQGTLQQDPQVASLSNDLQAMNQRLSAYDADNQMLNTEVASLKQKLQLANQYSQTLKAQLADTSGRVQQAEVARSAALQQLSAMKSELGQTQGQLAGFGGGSVPTQFGGATVRANNSLTERLSNVQVPGGQVRMDGDVLRIEFPSDRVFVPGSYQIQPAQLPAMQNIATTIRQNFPKQVIGIEAHWDNTALNPPTTTHQQLTATQALAVYDNLVRLGVPRSQMFTMAMGSNRPRHPQGMTGGVSRNRRIELVIYPETFDRSN